MIILDASLEEDAIRAVIDRATEVIRSRGGNLNRVDRWGKRRFAYELDHRWEGYYLLLEITAEPPALTELARVLSLPDEVLRHTVIRLPDRGAAVEGRGGGGRRRCEPRRGDRRGHQGRGPGAGRRRRAGRRWGRQPPPRRSRSVLRVRPR